MESNVAQARKGLQETLQEIQHVWVIPHLIFHNLISTIPQMGMLKDGEEVFVSRRGL